MIKIKVKTGNNMDFTIPVPYAVISICGSLISSDFVWTHIKNHTNQHTKNSLELVKNKNIKPLIKTVTKELRNQRGLTLIDVKLQDGTTVLVKL